MREREQPVAAILVDREYYSFLISVKEAEKVLARAARLGNRGSPTAITKTARLCKLGCRVRSRCCQAILTFLSVSENYLGFEYLDRACQLFNGTG